jgi:hypothetical protein
MAAVGRPRTVVSERNCGELPLRKLLREMRMEREPESQLPALGTGSTVTLAEQRTGRGVGYFCRGAFGS